MEKKTIGAFIAALRKANGLTQKQLADKLCVSDKAVSRWERDETLPDLTLIPVMAEIFGVTSDELLRGQRANPDAPLPISAPEKNEKQLRRFISAAKTKFKIQSVISIAVAFTGFIAAMICNFAFTRANLGFLLGCVFSGAAITCQVIFSILTRSKTDAEELDPETVAAIKNFLHRGNQITFSVIAMLLGISLPLVVHVPDAYWGLPANTYALLCLVYAAVCAMLCALACWIINVKLGYSAFTKKAKLRLITLAILLPVLGVSAFGHAVLAAALSTEYHLFYEGTKCETFEEFREIIETPLGPDGESLEFVREYEFGGRPRRVYQDSEGTEYEAYLWEHEWQLGVPGEPYYEANKTIWCISYDDGCWYLYTGEQYTTLQNRFTLVNLLIALIYPIEIATAGLICRKKMQALSLNA